MTTDKLPTLIFTGGHHNSALALALELKKLGWNIVWVGHRISQWLDKSDSAEYSEVTAAGIEFIDLRAGKFYKTYHPLKLLRIPGGFIKAFFIVLSQKIKYGQNLRGIITFGGYLGVPVVFAGKLMQVPTLAHEQTVVAGWANKFISLFAQKIAVSWSNSLKYYPENKVVLAGLPLRKEIIDIKNKGIKEVTGKIYITGGKQGSHIINSAVFSVLNDLLEKFTLVHQTGSSTVYKDFLKAKSLRASLPVVLRSKYKIYKYLNPAKMAQNLATSEVVVSRTGGHIILELALLGTKSVLIPIPWSSHNEQYHNAMLLANAGQAVLLPESDLAGNTLKKALNDALLLKPQPIEVNIHGMENMILLVKHLFGEP